MNGNIVNEARIRNEINSHLTSIQTRFLLNLFKNEMNSCFLGIPNRGLVLSVLRKCKINHKSYILKKNL